MKIIRAGGGLLQFGGESTPGAGADSLLSDAKAVRESEIGGGVWARSSMGRCGALYVSPEICACVY
jgi:hypothetical protein